MEKEMIEHLCSIFGERLTTIASYYMDNEQYFIFVLSEITFKDLENSRRINFSIPVVFFTEEELADGKDVFSLEFLNIQNSYEMIYGKDVFKGLKFQKKNVRLQLEFELRSKLINLRSEFSRIRDERGLMHLIDSILPAFMPLVSGLLFLKGENIPNSREQVFEKIKEKYGVQTEVLNTIYQHNLRTIDIEDFNLVVKKVLKFLAEIAEVVDEMKIK